jgi:hypothetical protein
MDDDEKNFVAQLLKNHGFEDVDPGVQNLLIVLQERTLGSKVATHKSFLKNIDSFIPFRWV